MIIGGLIRAAVSGGVGAALGPDVGKAAGDVAEKLFGKVWREVADRTRAYGRLPAGHEVEGAIRLAQLTASLFVVRSWEEANAYTWAHRTDAPEPLFRNAAVARLHDELGVCWNLKRKPNDELARELAEAMDAGLADARARSPDQAARALRNEAEAAAFADLTDPLGMRVPDGFHDLFMDRTAGRPGWFPCFIAFMRETLKDNESARTALVVRDLSTLLRRTEGLHLLVAGLSGDAAAIQEAIRRVEAKVDVAVRDIAQIKRMIEALPHVGHAEAVEILGAVRAALPKDFASVPDERLPEALKAFVARAEALEAQFARDTNLPAAVEAARQRARALVEALRIEEAEQELGAAQALLRENREHAAREEAKLLCDQAYLAGLRLGHRDAARRLDEAAILVSFDAQLSWQFALEAANQVQELGQVFGDTEAMNEAVDRYRACLDRAPRNRMPIEWASTQNDLGTALRLIGVRSDSTVLLQAIEAYRFALQERRRDRAPRDWAATQNNLGSALHALGLRGNDTALTEAVESYRLALEIFRRDDAPLDWARTQNNLGITLRALGERGDGEALRQAVEAHSLALQVYRRDETPLDWAAAQNNLGVALHTLGMQGFDGALEQAVLAFRLALEEYRRDRAPVAWAASQNNLGNVLSTIGERGDVAAAKHAVDAHNLALQQYQRDRSPLDWAGTQNSLGVALLVLGIHGDEVALHRAVEAFRLALEERRRDRVPLQWARTQHNLGNAFRTLGGCGDDAALHQAIEVYGLALQERRRERVPLQWALTQYYLGQTLLMLGERGDDKAPLEKAIACYRGAMEIFERLRHASYAQMAKRNLERAETLLKERGG
jgi:hypothetical protein